jgi:hypothetical protein
MTPKPKPSQHDLVAQGLNKFREECVLTRGVLSYVQTLDATSKRDHDLIARLFTELLTVEMTIGRF